MKKTTYIRLGMIGLLIAYIVAAYPGFYPFPQLTGKVVSYLLNLFNIESVIEGTYLLVSFPGISRILELSAECSGIVLFSMFVFGIFIVPDIPLKHRLMAIPFIPALFFGNVIRILLGIILGYNISIDFLVFFHNTMGQVLMFFWAIAIYMIWLHILGNFPREKEYYKSSWKF